MALVACTECGTEISDKAAACPKCGAPLHAATPSTPSPLVVSVHKSRGIAMVLALFLGGLGLHKFYLGQVGMGVLYLLFCWTFIPTIIGFLEAIGYLLMGEAKFQATYAPTVAAVLR